MTWFSYQSLSATPYTMYPPVRREIKIENINENLKVGDWLYVSLVNLNIGKVYSITGNEITESFDSDSYLVTYYDGIDHVPTYSFIDDNSILYFKSISSASAGSDISGTYYINYHSDDIQYIQKINGTYYRTTNPGGSNYIASFTGSGNQYIDLYPNIIFGDSTNDRVASIAYLASTGSWQDQTNALPDSRALGTFDGPRLKIYGKKGPNFGIVEIKITKTSSSNLGQKVILVEEIDLFNSSVLDNEIIYSIDLEESNFLSDYDDLHGSFSFEVKILNKKNISSSGTFCSVNKYSYLKKYDISIKDEEINDNINFLTTGAVK